MQYEFDVIIDALQDDLKKQQEINSFFRSFVPYYKEIPKIKNDTDDLDISESEQYIDVIQWFKDNGNGYQIELKYKLLCKLNEDNIMTLIYKTMKKEDTDNLYSKEDIIKIVTEWYLDIVDSYWLTGDVYYLIFKDKVTCNSSSEVILNRLETLVESRKPKKNLYI